MPFTNYKTKEFTFLFKNLLFSIFDHTFWSLPTPPRVFPFPYKPNFRFFLDLSQNQTIKMKIKRKKSKEDETENQQANTNLSPFCLGKLLLGMAIAQEFR